MQEVLHTSNAACMPLPLNMGELLNGVQKALSKKRKKRSTENTWELDPNTLVEVYVALSEHLGASWASNLDLVGYECLITRQDRNQKARLVALSWCGELFGCQAATTHQVMETAMRREMEDRLYYPGDLLSRDYRWLDAQGVREALHGLEGEPKNAVAREVQKMIAHTQAEALLQSQGAVASRAHRKPRL